MIFSRFAKEKPGDTSFDSFYALIYLIIVPLMIVLTNMGDEALDCYMPEGSRSFARAHLPSLIIPYWGATVAYFYCHNRTRCAPPLLEVLLNGALVLGVVMHGLVTFQLLGGYGSYLVLLLPITTVGAIALLLVQLARNHRLLMAERFGPTPTWVGDELESDYQAEVGKYRDGDFYQLLTFPLFVKSPLLLIALIPYIVALDAFLLLFGQQPDSFLLVFTQTYHKGFSELQPICNVARYDGHYLCSVAAGGHPAIVRPIRMGVRHGRRIICNRQLLVANAFEELLQERFPAAHRIIRRNYDRVGDFIHKDYTPYQNPWLCDAIYLLMKPADWCFRAVLYLCDRRPEERIARQYK